MFTSPWKLGKGHILPVNQNLSTVYFSLAKFQLVSCNLPLAMTWQMTYNSQTAKTVFSHLNRRLSASAIRLSKWTKFLQFDNNRTGGEKKQNLSLQPLGLCRELGKGCTHFPVHGGYLHYLRPNCLRRVLPVLPILASSCFLFASCNRL